MWSKPKPKQNDCNSLVRQDPRTSVKTTTAQSETTNSTVQNATIFNSNTNTVTYLTTRQTVVHQQQARVTEIVSRRTPTTQELEELMRQFNVRSRDSSGSTNSNRRSGNFTTAANRSSIEGISTKSAPKFKSSYTAGVPRLKLSHDSFNSAPQANVNDSRSSGNYQSTKTTTPPTPTLIKTIQTSVTSNEGRTVTSQLEQQRINRTQFNLSSPNSPLSKTVRTTTNGTNVPDKSFNSALALKNGITLSKANNIDARPYQTTPKTSATTTSTYQSPYRSTTSHANALPSSLSRGLSTTSTTSSESAIPKQKSNLKPGYVYIFNHERFDNNTNEERKGTAADVAMLTQTFKNLKLKVETYKDATLKKYDTVVKEIQKKDYKNNSCIVICILSHGTRYETIAAKDGTYSVDDKILFPILSNKTLDGKPKIFFIQACKGPYEVKTFHKDAIPYLDSANEVLKCYSTFEGYVAYRTEDGSDFIQSLTTNLQKNGKFMDIRDIMNDVTIEVKNLSEGKQIPSIQSTMTSKFCFGDYI